MAKVTNKAIVGVATLDNGAKIHYQAFPEGFPVSDAEVEIYQIKPADLKEYVVEVEKPVEKTEDKAPVVVQPEAVPTEVPGANPKKTK